MILVLDDEPLILDVAGRSLVRGGYAVRSHIKAAEARWDFQHCWEKWDLVVLDLDFSIFHSSIAHTLTWLRSIHPEVPVAITSGWGPDETAFRLGSCRVDGIIYKPYTGADLTGIAGRLISEACQSVA